MFMGRKKRWDEGNKNGNGPARPYRHFSSPNITENIASGAYGHSGPSGTQQNTVSLSSDYPRNKKSRNSRWDSASQYRSGGYGSNTWNQPSSLAPYDIGPSHNTYSHSSDYNRDATGGPPVLSFEYGMGPQRAPIPMLNKYDAGFPSHSLGSYNVGSYPRPPWPPDSSVASYNYIHGAPSCPPSHVAYEHSSIIPTDKEAQLAISILSTILKDKAVEPMHQSKPPFQMTQEEGSFQSYRRRKMNLSQRRNRKFDTQRFPQDYGDAGPAGYQHTGIKKRLSGSGFKSAYQTKMQSQPIVPLMDMPIAQQHGQKNKSMSHQVLGNQHKVSEERGTKLFDSSQFKFKCKNIPQNPLSVEKKQKDISAKAARGVSSRCLKCHICNENNFAEVQNFHEHLQSSSHARLVKTYVDKLSTAYGLMALDVQMVSRRQCIKEVLERAGQSSRRGKGSQVIQFKNKYYGLFSLLPKCKICQVPKITKHETLREVKILHDFMKPTCPFCNMKFTSRILYEEHKLTVSHLMNVWEEEKDTGEKSKFWSKLKVEYLRRFDSIGKSIENFDKIKVKNYEKKADIKDEFNLKKENEIKEDKEDVPGKAENNDKAVKKEIEGDATINDSISQKEKSEEISENEKNKVGGNDEAKEVAAIGINEAEKIPENNEENKNQEEGTVNFQPQAEESNAQRSGLRTCDYAGCDKKHTSEDLHAYCIQHDVCMREGAFDPENCPTCKLWVTPLQGLPLDQIRTMNQYRRLKIRWNKARKISKSKKPRWRNLELMIELGFISKESAEKLGSGLRAESKLGMDTFSKQDIKTKPVPKDLKPVSIKGAAPVLSAEAELFMLREHYPTVISYEEMLLHPYVPDVPFGVNFLINHTEAYCVSCRECVGSDTNAIEKHCKSRQHYQSLKGYESKSGKSTKAASSEKMEKELQLEDYAMEGDLSNLIYGDGLEESVETKPKKVSTSQRNYDKESKASGSLNTRKVTAKGHKNNDPDDFQDRQMKQEDSQTGCESKIQEGEVEETEDESVKCLNLESTESDEERPEEIKRFVDTGAKDEDKAEDKEAVAQNKEWIAVNEEPAEENKERAEVEDEEMGEEEADKDDAEHDIGEEEDRFEDYGQEDEAVQEEEKVLEFDDDEEMLDYDEFGDED